jgi:transposase
MDAMHPQDHTIPTAWIGIDVSQHTLDACFLPAEAKPRCRSFANDPAGHADLLAWAGVCCPAAGTLGFCRESTGAYGQALAYALTEAGQHVSIVNPARIKYAGLMRGQGNKTDKADAKLIAEYAQRERPPAWNPPPAETRELQALVRRRDDLRQLAGREKGRLAAPGLTTATRRSIRRTVAFLEREAQRLQEQADTLISASQTLAANRDLLVSIPGVGTVTATTILGELPDPAHFASAQQAAAYAGLAPREYRSGTSVRKRTRLSKAGNARLRKALYLPTLTAIRFNPLLGGFFERLVTGGKSRMAAVGACMRKLLMIAYGVLKSRVPFDPLWGRK